MVRLQELTGRKVEPEDFKSVRTINDVLNLAQRMHAQG
jgi:acyl carrier protein